MILTNKKTTLVPVSVPNFVEVEEFCIEGYLNEETGINTVKIKSLGKKMINMAIVSKITPDTLKEGQEQYEPVSGRIGYWSKPKTSQLNVSRSLEVMRLSGIHREIKAPATFVVFSK